MEHAVIKYSLLLAWRTDSVRQNTAQVSGGVAGGRLERHAHYFRALRKTTMKYEIGRISNSLR